MSKDKEEVVELTEEPKQELLRPGFSPDLVKIMHEAITKIQFSGKQHAAAVLMISAELERVHKEWEDKQPKEEPEEEKEGEVKITAPKKD